MFSLSKGFLSWVADIHSWVSRASLSNQHLLLGKNHRRASTVHGGPNYFYIDSLPNDWTSRRLWILYDRVRCRVADSERFHIVRLFDIMRKLFNLDGIEHWTTRHYSIFNLRRIFPQLRLGSVILWMVVLSLMVPLWQRSAFGESMDRRDRHNLYALKHHLPNKWKNHFGNTQLRSGECLRAA